VTATTTIPSRIHVLIRDEILWGQDEGLTTTTPLLELGILDSFALLKLVARLNGAYGIDIKPEDITGEDFRNIEAISALVVRRLGVVRDATALADDLAIDGPAVFAAPGCSQVFLLFTGLGRQLADGRRVVNWPVSRFFTQSGLADRNLIVFGDPYGQSYRQGVSAALSSPALICEWLREWIKAHPHIERIYALGISAGGPMAMVAGEALGADVVWAFAPRAVRREFVDTVPQTLLQMVEAATGKTLPQLEAGLTDEDVQRIDEMCTPEVADRYYKSYLDGDTLLDREHLSELAAHLVSGTGSTEHRVLYCPRDACDAQVAALLSTCPRVKLMEVAPSDAAPRPWLFARWLPPSDWLMRDHFVTDRLLERQALRPLFPPFEAARALAARSRW
jgi:peptidyl carrier protein